VGSAAGSIEKKRSAVAFGASAETYVCDLLMEQGWRILARNWRGGAGELDIVALRNGLVRIVEVKARTDGDPLLAITPRKQRRLISAAQAFLASCEEPWEAVSFSIAMVKGKRLSWLHDAFDA
jgi:putative endonuclease